MAIVALVVVLVGFAPTYFLSGVFRAAVFTPWIAPLVTQTSLT